MITKGRSVNRESGQVLIVILLIMAVALTVGISVVSRSIVGLRLSTQEEESARAFSVAEAGLEEAFLQDIVGINQPVTVGTSQASVTELEECKGETDFYTFDGRLFAAGDTGTVWLVGHDANGPNPTLDPFGVTEPVTVCWGVASGEAGFENFAVEVGLVFADGGVYQTGKAAFDADATRRTDNNFAAPDSSSACSGYAFSKTISLAEVGASGSDQPYALRIKPVYNANEQPLAVKTDGTILPAQGEGYEATATVGEGPGSTVRVKQCQFFKAPPDIFDYALFSDKDISH